jgi:photosystem II stability/assembly factor-like uncharacterized protein
MSLGFSQKFSVDAGKNFEMTCLDKAMLDAYIINWNSVYTNNQGFISLYFTDDQVGYATGGGPYGSVIAKTLDGGQNWIELQSPDEFIRLYDISFINKDTGIIVGGFEWVDSRIIRTVNGGLTWQEITSPVYSRLNAVEFVNETTAYAAGINSSVIKTTDGGNTWYTIPAPNGTYVDIEVLDENTILFLDKHGGFVFTNDGGQTFTKTATGITFYLNDIAVGRNGIFIAGDCGLLIYSENFFQTYEAKETGIVANLNNIIFKTETEGFIAASGGMILHTEDGGRIWKREKTGYNGSILGLAINNEGHVYAAGAEQVLMNNGTLFQYHPLPDTLIFRWYPVEGLSNPNDLTPIASPQYPIKYTLTVSDTNGNIASDTLMVDVVKPYVFAGADTMIRKNDSIRLFGVVQCARLSSVTTHSHITHEATHFINQDTGFMTGMNYSASAIIKTTDGGKSWSNRIKNLYLNLKDITFVNDTVGFVVGANGTILKTTDCGESWFHLNSGTTKVLNSVHFVDENLGFVAGNEHCLLKTTDGGLSWFNTYIPSWADIIKVYFVNENQGYATAVFNMEAAYLETSDGGNTWHKITIPGLITTFTDIYFVDEQNGYMLGGDLSPMVIMKTTDGGTTWNYYLFGSHGYTTFTSIFFTDAFTGYASNVIGEVYKTYNGGLKWYRLFSTGFGINDIFFTDKHHGIFVGDFGMYAVVEENPDLKIEWVPNNGLANSNNIFTLAMPDVETIFTLKASVEGGCVLSDHVSIKLSDAEVINERKQTDNILIYPNPSSGNVIINFEKFTLPMTFEVFSLQGEKILNYGLSPLQKELNINNLHKEVYVIRVSGNGQFSYAKLIINE